MILDLIHGWKLHQWMKDELDSMSVLLPHIIGTDFNTQPRMLLIFFHQASYLRSYWNLKIDSTLLEELTLLVDWVRSNAIVSKKTGNFESFSCKKFCNVIQKFHQNVFRWKYVASTQHAICDHAGAVHRDKVSSYPIFPSKHSPDFVILCGLKLIINFYLDVYFWWFHRWSLFRCNALLQSKTWYLGKKNSNAKSKRLASNGHC